MNLQDRIASRFRLFLAMSRADAKKILGFPPNANPTPDEVQKARRQMAFKNHPDRAENGTTEVPIRDINNAADLLLEEESQPFFRGEDPSPYGGYGGGTRTKVDPIVVTFNDAEAKAGVPSATWKLKTQNAFHSRGDESASACVVIGEMGTDSWVFVAIEHYRKQNAFTGEDNDIWWMNKLEVKGSLRDVAPGAIRKMFDFPHVEKNFNAKMEILPEGLPFSEKLLFTNGRKVSFKDALDLMGELKDDDPWKGRKLEVTMVLNSKSLDPASQSISFLINGREYKLSPESVVFIDKRTKVLSVIFGRYVYWNGEKKVITKSKSGKKVLEYLSEKLVHEPPALREALLAAANQMPGPAKTASMFDRIVSRVAAAKAEGMGAWDGKEHDWPEVPGFIFAGSHYDRFGDAYKASYQCAPRRPWVELFVHFDAVQFVGSGGEKPMTWEARGPGGQTKKGTTRKIEDIPDVLQDALKWAQGLHKETEEQLKNVGGSSWEANYDGYELDVAFKSPSSSTMYVTFADVENAVFEGEPGEAIITFMAGSDYQGPYGRREEKRPYRSIDDINRILKEAEKLWERWTA